MKRFSIDRRGLLLTCFGLLFGGITIVTVSECTGDRDVSTAAWLAAPSVPAALQLPGGAVPSAHFHGKGAQIYTCAASPSGGSATPTFAWTLKAPDATLFDATGAEVGVHTAGPTWTSSRDGSAVVGTKTAQADAPVAGAVPWLLLQAKSTGDGVFAHLAFIQRVNTSGGVAPAGGCDAATVGAEQRVSYEADYYFY